MEQERAGLVAKRDALRVGGPGRIALRAVTRRELLRLALAVGRRDVQLVLAGRVGEVRDPAAIGAPRRVALGDAARAREVARRALLRGQGPDVAARFASGALAAGRKAPSRDELRGVDRVRPQRAAGRREW